MYYQKITSHVSDISMLLPFAVGAWIVSFRPFSVVVGGWIWLQFVSSQCSILLLISRAAAAMIPECDLVLNFWCARGIPGTGAC